MYAKVQQASNLLEERGRPWATLLRGKGPLASKKSAGRSERRVRADIASAEPPRFKTDATSLLVSPVEPISSPVPTLS